MPNGHRVFKRGAYKTVVDGNKILHTQTKPVEPGQHKKPATSTPKNVSNMRSSAILMTKILNTLALCTLRLYNGSGGNTWGIFHKGNVHVHAFGRV